MKTKLTVTIDESLVPDAKRFARSLGISLSQLIEDTLRREMEPAEPGTFAERWRGKLEPAEREGARYRHLARKYL